MSVRSAHLALVFHNYGEAPEEWMRRLVSVDLEESTEQAAVVRLSFEDALSLRESDLLKLKRQFYVVLGYTDDFQWRGPFLVREVVPKYGSNGQVTLQITGQDRSLAMNRKRTSKRHTGGLADIVKSIAKGYGLGFDIDDVQGESFDDDHAAHQSSETDAEFLRRLSNQYGFCWFIRDGVLHFKAPTSDSANPAMIFSWGINDRSISEYQPIYRSWHPSPSGAKMAGSSLKSGNVDIEKGEAFSITKTFTDAVKGLVGMGDDVKEEGEATAAEVAYTGADYYIDPEIGDLFLQGIPELSAEADASDSVLPRTATPPTAEDAAKALVGAVAAGSNITGGSITLRLGNISIRPRFTVQVLCPSSVDSGRFRVKSVKQSISKAGGFTTSFQIAKFGVGKGKSTQAAAEAAAAAADGSTASDTAGDSQIIAQLVQLNPELGTLLNVVEKVTTAVLPDTSGATTP